MKWLALYNKIGKQKASIIQKTDVIAIINDREIKLDIKFKNNGEPYFTIKDK